MGIVLAFVSSIFAAMTTILAKYGLKDVPSHLATAIRTIVVLVFSWIVVFIFGGGYQGVKENWHWLILSGLGTGFSWLCYYRALAIGNVNKVVPIDKCSTVLTMILAFIFLGDHLSFWKIFGMVVMLAGTFLMIRKKQEDSHREKPLWLFYAIGSCVFASLTSVFAKLGLQSVDANVATAIRTWIVLAMAWAMVFLTGQQRSIGKITKRDMTFLILSGLSTGLSWLFYFSALKMEEASVVAPIDKLSVLFTMVLSFVLLNEKFSLREWIGLVLLVAGTLLIALEETLPFFLF